MNRSISIAIIALALGAQAASQQPQPRIQGGKLETRQATSLDRDIASIGAAATEPVWIAWRVPMIDGQRQMCCWYYDDRYNANGVRGCQMEGYSGTTFGSFANAPSFTQPTGPVPLEGGTGLLMLVRVVDKRIERLRTFGDDCPLDTNGRTAYLLERVTPADSLKVLESLAHPDYANMTRGGADSLTSEAVSAIALHRDPAADAILDRLAASDPDPSIRRRAGSSLANNRGAHGFETIRKLIETERSTDVRRNLATALGQTRQPQTAAALLALVRNDADATVRSNAIYYLPQRGGEAMLSQVTALIDSDRDESVKRRGVTGIAQLPLDAGVPTLIQLATVNGNMTVRKQAVSELSHSKDPRAIEYLRSLIR